jgi:hypothetical protein
MVCFMGSDEIYIYIYIYVYMWSDGGKGVTGQMKEYIYIRIYT